MEAPLAVFRVDIRIHTKGATFSHYSEIILCELSKFTHSEYRENALSPICLSKAHTELMTAQRYEKILKRQHFIVKKFLFDAFFL